MSEETRVSDLKGVPKRVILTAPERVYPTTLIAYADLIVQDGMVVKDRHGMNREATPEDLASCKTLTPAEAKVLVDAAAWRGETPAEGTRRAIVLEAIKKGDVLSDAEALEIADTVELALLSSSDPANVTDRICDEIEAACDVLDQLDVPQEREGKHLDLGARVTALGDQLVEARRERDVKQATIEWLAATVSAKADALERRVDGLTKLTSRAEGKVPAGTRELCIVLDHGTPASLMHSGPKFVELETQDGVSVGGFESRWEPGTEIQRIVIPYGRDDAWVSEVAYQAAGAASGVFLREDGEKIMPAEEVGDAVAELLLTFGIPRACGGCQEEQIEHGRKEVAKPELSRAEGAVDLRPPDEFDIGQAARERLHERLTEGPVPNPAELARVIDILR